MTIFRTVLKQQTSHAIALIILFFLANVVAYPKTQMHSNRGRQQLLTSLRKRLDKVRAVRVAKGDKPFDAPAGDDVSALVGMTRTRIRMALNEPHVCHVPIEYAPCKEEGDWFYSFYYLPDGYNGGGPELFLTFGDKGICKTAKWVYTQ